MATKQSTAEYLVDQMSGAGDVRIRKMFGEYAVYCDDKVVALICDDMLFVKPTAAGKSFIGTVVEAPPYPQAKPHYRIDGDQCEDREWLSMLIAKTADELPQAKRKK